MSPRSRTGQVSPLPDVASPGRDAPALLTEIRPLRTEAELTACVALQRRTWGESFAEVVPPPLMKIVQRLGGVAAGAFAEQAGGELLGFVFGLSGLEDGRPVHWSDMLAVSPKARDRGLGERLKRWQREQVLARGYRIMRWSFDPLESRNAWLNLSRLGAISSEYVPNMYGDMDSPLHAGLGTDRLLVRWDLDSPRVVRRLAGEHALPSPDDVAGLPVVNRIVRESPWPECADCDMEQAAARVLLAIPADIQGLRAAAPELARAWRAHTRAAFRSCFERGYTATGLVRRGSWSAYLLDSACSAGCDETPTRALPR